MKPNQGTSPCQSLVRLAALALLAAIVSSCSPGTAKLDPATHTVPAISNSWVKVRSKPPTWYPRGVAADHPKDHRSGSWIHAEDSLGTRFFIPFHGLPPDSRKALEAEALAARHPERVQEIADENTRQMIGSVITTVLTAPFLAAGGMGL